MHTLPVFALARHRIDSDGPGVTTLVGVQGCPLACRWCINPHARPAEGRARLYSAADLFEAVRPDALYFAATGGGVTFGGGEPLLHAAFLPEFRALAGGSWRLNAETSLNVAPELIRLAAESLDLLIVDIKDTDPAIYRRYTGGDVRIPLQNLEYLLARLGPDRIRVRAPLIPEYNTPADRQKSVALLQKMGLTQIETFSYVRPAP